MRIELAPANSLGLLGRAPGMIPEWRVGAVVEAVAVRDATTGQLWLNLGQMRLPARVASGDPAGPAEGESLRLRVLRNSPVLAFESLEATGETRSDPASDALRRTLPRQSSPAALFAALGTLARSGNLEHLLPARVADKMARLWGGIATTAQLGDAAGVAAAVSRSGLFMENRLATQSGAALKAIPLEDLKALLLNLKEALTSQGARELPPRNDLPAPLPMLRGSLLPLTAAASTLANVDSVAGAVDALARDTDGALARLTATQLINHGAGGLAWLVEIPVRHEDEARMLRFRFERESAEESSEQTGWTVEAALELGSTQSVHARVSLRQQRVSVHLRSDAPHVVARLKAHAGELTLALERAGLNVDQVVCLHGLPVDDAGQSRARLVDLRA
jgi:hypothetical protein